MRRRWSWPGCSARSRATSRSRPPRLTPYVLTFAGLWLAGQIVWRIAIALIARVEIRGMEALYIEAMDELLAKDLAFFQNNYAGSLTKRALGYARRFEDVFDVLAFQVAPTCCRSASSASCSGRYSPLAPRRAARDAGGDAGRWSFR